MKFKYHLEYGKLIVKAKKKFDEEISFREVDALARINSRGFLKPRKTSRNKIEYVGPKGISLAERLRRPISRQEFFNYMIQVVLAVKKIKENNLFVNNLLLDFRYVFVNQQTQEVLFIYMPLITNHVIVDVLGFMKGIAYSAIPLQNERPDYIPKFQVFLKNLKSFDEDRIYNYILREEPGMKKGNNSSGFMTDKPRDYYAHYDNNGRKDESTSLITEDNEEATGLLMEDDLPTGLLVEDDENTGLLIEDDENTGLLIEDDSEGTTLLAENQIITYPSLYRILTNERISINKPVFRIGKERSYVDFFVSNNNAISRSHADIITRGNKYYIMDLNSKNHTYIDGQMIPVRCEVEIFNGCRIKLANEEFVFEI
ncbi:MAG: FHA domain-containing protein [Ruminococcus sp.]